MVQMAAMFSVGLCFSQGALNPGQLPSARVAFRLFLSCRVTPVTALQGQIQHLERLSGPGAVPQSFCCPSLGYVLQL